MSSPFKVLLIVIGLLLGTCQGPVRPAFACDTQFVQEPTTWGPQSIEINTVSGLVTVTYRFWDGRVLVTVYQILDVTTEESVITEKYPLFYITSGSNYMLKYIDRGGHGYCYEIERY